MTTPRMTTSGMFHRAFVATGAMFAAAGVALSAYAAHAVDADARASLSSAALFALVHGIALAALSRQTRRIGMVALAALLLGTLLFSGSLVGAHFFALPTRPAPVGGMLMIGGWLLYAVDAFRR
jgi:uncharacterized membrane protein YgdD (TMEM256/DUF423 family)